MTGKGVVVKWERKRRQNHWFDALYNACAAGYSVGNRLVQETPAKPQPKPVVIEPDERSWTKARYSMLRDRGMKHHAAIRKLARSWIKILFRVWQTEVPFDCDRYITQLKQRCPEITRYLPQEICEIT